MSRASAVLGAIGCAAALACRGATVAEAGTYCFTRGDRTYCDDGRAYYLYGKTIVSNEGKRWRTFGSHTYGPDGEWIARHGKGRYTGSYPGAPGDEAQILPDVLDRAADGDEDDGGDAEGE